MWLPKEVGWYEHLVAWCILFCLGVCVSGNFLDLMAQMSMPIYSFHCLFHRGSLDRMADQIGLVEPINHLPGVCTAINSYTTIILCDCTIIDICKKIVVSEETDVDNLLSGRHWPISTRQCQMDMLAVRSYDLVPWDVVVGLLRWSSRWRCVRRRAAFCGKK